MSDLSYEEIEAVREEIASSLHCALPGIVESFDDVSGLASVRLALSGMPILQDVPVFVCNEVSVGDACLVVLRTAMWMPGLTGMIRWILCPGGCIACRTRLLS